MNVPVYVFELQSRTAMLEAVVNNESSLIKTSLRQQLVGKSGAEAESIYVTHEYEIEQLHLWANYLQRELCNRFSNGLPPQSLQRPDSECLPRSRMYWTASLGAELDVERSDPFLGVLVDFCVAFMVASAIGAGIDAATRTRLLDQVRRRLKPLSGDEGFPGRSGDRVTSALHLKPSKKN